MAKKKHRWSAFRASCVDFQFYRNCQRDFPCLACFLDLLAPCARLTRYFCAVTIR